MKVQMDDIEVKEEKKAAKRTAKKAVKRGSKKHKAQPKKKELSRTEIRRRRKKARKRIVLFQRLLATCIVLAVIGAAGYFVWNIPSFRLSRQLDAGMEYTQEEAYDAAIEAYETALEIDSSSVEAYRCMAGAYLDMEDGAHAKQALFDGWQNTQDESLLQYYCTVILNEAVDDINNDAVSQETIEKIGDVLVQDTLREEALELLETACSRLKETMAGSFDFMAYSQAADALLALYRSTGLEQVRQAASDFGWLELEELKLPMEYIDVYRSLLEDTNALAEIPERTDRIACLGKIKEVQEEFADIFAELDAGNYEAAKDFLVKDSYLQIRDAFINGTMEYWEGATYIPVSREYVTLKLTDGKSSFAFPNFRENEETAGILTVWGNEMLDNGVQRSSLTYEPAKEGEGYYPHTEYIISYMCSNVQKKNAFVYEMNYHFETRVETEAGTTTTMIGDWGGPYQWQKTY